MQHLADIVRRQFTPERFDYNLPLNLIRPRLSWIAAFTFQTTMRSRRHYHVYVIELSKDVLYEGRFKRCNPGYVSGKPCVYVGMTGIDPDVRFDKHKAGIQSNRYVKEFGLRLLPDLYEAFNPMSYDEACAKEVEVGIDLREAGFGVWQA
jgi:predicted GIY-YIG superfamily endonuclease